MTTDHADQQNDDILAAVASLRTPDVSQRRARGLRRRCHVLLQAQSGPTKPAAMVTMSSGTAFQRIIGPALGGAWCLAYLVEIARRAAAVYFTP
jgi:hypothetical protein